MIRICQFSDIHLPVSPGEVAASLRGGFSFKRLAGAANLFLRRGGHYRAAGEKVAAFARFAAREKFDALLFTGDFSSLGMACEWARLREAFAPVVACGTPLLFTPGNHDLYVAREVPGFAAAFADLLAGPAGAAAHGIGDAGGGPGAPLERVVELDLGPVAVLVYNSARPNANPLVSSGRVAEPVLATLRGMSRHPRLAGKVLFHATHYGPRGPAGRHEPLRGLDNAGELEALLDATPAALLCHGHTHRPFRGETPGGRPVFCAGSLTRDGMESLLAYEFAGRRLAVRRGAWDGAEYELPRAPFAEHLFPC